MSKGFLLLLWVLFVQLAALYLFTSGFLLTRLSLSDVTTCRDSSCKLPATHKRAVFLVIDALRFDFVSPDPPIPSSPHHHNVLTLPRQLTAKQPENSLLFYSYADPPTTTLQRIKGVTTGSLPTFVDIGNNFGGSSIAEDSIIKQLNIAGKKVAFMGDDTWMSVFPDSFQPNMRFPYDSFNVEDLHTVDEGVIRHMFPLLNDTSKPFDFLIGHFLGVDHVGHRVGPDHPSMKAKLTQMNDVLKRVVNLLDDDTLLVVLGDHGMDRSGDHGGDGDLETGAALWIYSKRRPIAKVGSTMPSGLLQYKPFPGTMVAHRWIQQIDIVPTLSLLLGLPIPFNNLGTVIPEIFWREESGATLKQALELNVAQIKAYLQAYRQSSSGSELDGAWDDLQSAWKITTTPNQSTTAQLITLSNYPRVALSACRKMWAQFNSTLMVLGLSLMAVHILTIWGVYNSLSRSGVKVSEAWIGQRLPNLIRGAAAGAVIGLVLSLGLPASVGLDALDSILFTAPLGSTLTLFSFSSITFTEVQLAPLLLMLHALCFLSNSFTFWEDRIVPFLLFTSILPFAWSGLYAPTSRLRYRILGFSLLFSVCTRLMGMSTVCREEQGAYCHVTFYASSSLPSPPLLVTILALPVAIALPKVIRRFLHTSRSDSGLASSYLPVILAPSLLAGPIFWLIEWVDSVNVLDESQSVFLRFVRTWVARLGFVIPIVGGGALWLLAPICLDVEIIPEQQNQARQVKIIGFANTFGSPYLLFWTIFFALIYTTTQLTGQVVLALGVIALISYLEVLDSVRDARVMQSSHTLSTTTTTLSTTVDPAASLDFRDTVPLALLGLHMFYTTGHESVISSIQWKSAFMLTPTMSYWLSALTVVMNSLGPVLLVGVAAPLVALWNRAPMSVQSGGQEPLVATAASTSKKGSVRTDSAVKNKPEKKTEAEALALAPTSASTSESDLEERTLPDTQIRAESTLAGLGLSLYYSALLFGSALSAAILRRHLMVWKVFAPRFMAGGLELIVVDLGVLVGVGIGVDRIAGYVNGMFVSKDRVKGVGSR